MDAAISTRVGGLTVRRYYLPGEPLLVYLPGIHGDWTLVPAFRCSVCPPLGFVELAYPDRVDWTMADYASAVELALARLQIRRCWLLAESFGSLVAWGLLERLQPQDGAGPDASRLTCSVQGLILAGGFVRHPCPLGARALAALGRRLPDSVHRTLLRGYARMAGWRHRHAPETRDNVTEFLERRTSENRRAIHARLQLVARADYRTVAARTRLPVHALAGFWDPLVPWWLVWPWLRRHCPGFQEARMFWRADHNVLGTAPRPAAAAVLAWVGARPQGFPE